MFFFIDNLYNCHRCLLQIPNSIFIWIIYKYKFNKIHEIHKMLKFYKISFMICYLLQINRYRFLKALESYIY